MDRLAAMQAFSRVVERGSFSEVARELGVSQPTISKQIAALERDLGANLLRRTSRTMTLTDAGARFYDHCRHILAMVERAEDDLRGEAEPRGLLRLACPTVFGRVHVMPHLPAFLARHEHLQVELVLSDAFVDLVAQGIDLAIRIGRLIDPNLIVRKLGSSSAHVIGTPEYFERAGIPQHPSELVSHQCVLYTPFERPDAWRFEEEGEPLQVPVSGRFRTNSSEALREAMLAHLGVAMIPRWLAQPELDQGRLMTVLDGFSVHPIHIYAAYTPAPFLSARVRAFIDYIAPIYAQSLPIRQG